MHIIKREPVGEPMQEHGMIKAHSHSPGAFIDIGHLVALVEAARAKMADALEELVSKMADASSTEADVDFGGLVKAAQRLLELDDGDMARMLKVSRPTIGRWIRGVSQPHPLGRGAIFDALSGQARIKARNLRS